MSSDSLDWLWEDFNSTCLVEEIDDDSLDSINDDNSYTSSNSSHNIDCTLLIGENEIEEEEEREERGEGEEGGEGEERGEEEEEEEVKKEKEEKEVKEEEEKLNAHIVDDTKLVQHLKISFKDLLSIRVKYFGRFVCIVFE